ncbi:MAG: hypothetical protein Q9196_005311 [Gyalolechia fulgens]
MPPKKPPLTHFLCIPLTSNAATQWQESLQQFTTNIQSLQTRDSLSPSTCPTVVPTPTSSPIPVRAIRPLGTLHLTLGIMSLPKPEKVEAATALLRSLDMAGMLAAAEQKHSEDMAGAAVVQSEAEQHNPSLADSRTEPGEASRRPPSQPLTLSFKGLKSMHAPGSTTFLYAPPTDETGRLYPLCHAIKDRFAQDGFMIEEKRALKLHATILNTIYAGKVYPRKVKDDYMGDAKATEPGSAEVVDKNEGSDRGHHDEGRPYGRPDEQEPPAEEHEPTESRTKEVKEGKTKSRRKKEAIKFDARDLLARYTDFEWARDVRIEKLVICEMGAKKIMDEKGEVVGEEYTEIASVPLP